MQFIPVLLVIALTFGVCFLLDKGYTKLFRSKAQHQSGLSVRVNKRYALFGLVFAILGFLGLINSKEGGLLLLIGGGIVMVAGVALLVYYMTFGIFYDDEGFLLTTFGKKSVTYRFADIRQQQLYIVQGGNVVVELLLADGRPLSLQTSMEGVYPFLDHAFLAWCRQTDRDPENCPFHDPSQSLWFPTEEEA